MQESGGAYEKGEQEEEEMKKVEHYICEICGTEYKDKKTCMECEKGHHTPKKIAGATYVSIKNDRSGYPMRVHVEMSNGETITYKR